jgi:hypothetical protein
MNRQEIVETIQEITGMAVMLGLTTPEQIHNYDAVFSEKFGAGTMAAFYQTTVKNKSPIYLMICQALEAHESEVAE